MSRDVKLYENVFPFKMSSNVLEKGLSNDVDALNFFDSVFSSSLIFL